MQNCWILAIVSTTLLGQSGGKSGGKSGGTLTPTGNMAVSRHAHTATLLSDGKVLVAGGEAYHPTGGDAWATAELYDPSAGVFIAIGNMTRPRAGHTATLLPGGKVLISGGDGVAGASAELYDPSTGIFSATGEMTTSRWGLHTATLLDTGKVLIAGGSNWRDGQFRSLDTAELYDPSSGIFTPTGPMTTASDSWGIRAVLLTSGKVLLVRRPRGDGAILTYELYDPAAGTFSLTGPSAYPRMYPETVTLLRNGNVLVTLSSGGDDGFRATELYDPGTGTFTAASGVAPGEYLTGTVLSNGAALVTGMDYIPGGGGSASTYDVMTNTFSTSIRTREVAHTATLLLSGGVLLSGGCCGRLHTGAEIFRPDVVTPAPALLSLSPDGPQHEQGPGAILHADTHEIVSSSNPAIAGEALEVYCSGLLEGSPIPPQIVIGGKMAEILWFGNAPGISGVNQVNVRVPGGVAPGSAVPVRLTYISRPSNEVTIGVR